MRTFKETINIGFALILFQYFLISCENNSDRFSHSYRALKYNFTF